MINIQVNLKIFKLILISSRISIKNSWIDIVPFCIQLKKVYTIFF